MSGTQTPTPAVDPMPLPSDNMLTPQSIVAFACVAIGAASIAAAFVLGDAQMRGQALIAGVAALAATYGFYLGSSKGSADQHARAPVVAPQPASVAPVVGA